MTKSPRGTKEQQPDYLAHLLHPRRMRGEGATGWWASLVSPHTGERHGFANLDDLFVFLRRQTAKGSDTDSDGIEVKW